MRKPKHPSRIGNQKKKNVSFVVYSRARVDWQNEQNRDGNRQQKNIVKN